MAVKHWPARLSRLLIQAPFIFDLSSEGTKVHTLTDGRVLWDAGLLSEASDAQLGRAQGSAGRESRWAMNYNAFLLERHEGYALVDTGAGALATAWPGHGDLGQVGRRLRDAGVHPHEVRDIFITHVHFDHIGGLVGEGKPRYSNAVVHVDARELQGLSDVPDPLIPYERSNRLHLFSGPTTFGAVSSVDLGGHTRGHSGYLVGGRGRSILFIGDVVHCAEVQFPYPSISSDSDLNKVAAASARREALTRSDQHGVWLAGAHLPDPGIGLARRAGDGFVWIPAAAQAKLQPM